MKITLYTTHCQKCKILEEKMSSKGITFDVVDDVEEMTRIGMLQSPMLHVDDKLMNFVTAISWVNGCDKQ